MTVFNTYGSLGNAALLHRYGFTEPDNPFDILNLDLDIVEQWSLSLFSCRHSRKGCSVWRRKGQRDSKPPFAGKGEFLSAEDSEASKKLLLTRGVRQALLSLADARESLYGPNSLDDDINSFTESSHITDPKLYSLTLRISERRIIERLRSFASSGAGILRTAVGTRKRRRVEGT
ncbi:UNVERIFIED_CONTAM: hypothetical protein Sangu_2137600 [Sesamum angustifolium]|uniref:Rubisco methyltransferase family protein n=1 Tax=Sesamum angustifolium TaxID=2727405 RepID=A0AAW2LEU3_9LAMI